MLSQQKLTYYAYPELYCTCAARNRDMQATGIARRSMDGSGISSGKAGAYLKQQQAVQRRNLLGICRMCIKSLVDKAAFETMTDDCPDLKNFCIIMEHIFTHMLQARWSLFSSNEAPQFWPVVAKLAPRITVGSVQDMEEIQTDMGKGRAWIRLALVQKKLSGFFTLLLSRTEHLRSHYQAGAFLLSTEEMTELAGTLRCLDSIDFNLCLRGHDFDFGELPEIDYSPYLQFHQSIHSIADDTIEEKKLLSSRAERGRQLGWGGGVEGEEEEADGGGERPSVGEGEASLVQLREMLKTEREQKNYFEELVLVRDSQLSKAQSELSSQSKESEMQRSQLEEIVIELQQEIERQQVQLKEAQRKIEKLSRTVSFASEQSQTSAAQNGPAASQDGASDSSSRKRATSLSVFTNFWGSQN